MIFLNIFTNSHTHVDPTSFGLYHHGKAELWVAKTMIKKRRRAMMNFISEHGTWKIDLGVLKQY